MAYTSSTHHLYTDTPSNVAPVCVFGWFVDPVLSLAPPSELPDGSPPLAALTPIRHTTKSCVYGEAIGQTRHLKIIQM